MHLRRTPFARQMHNEGHDRPIVLERLAPGPRPTELDIGNVPQADANSVRVGQTASLTVTDLSSRTFAGTVTRTANALDPASINIANVRVRAINSEGTKAYYHQWSGGYQRQLSPVLVVSADYVGTKGERHRQSGPRVGFAVGLDEV